MLFQTIEANEDVDVLVPIAQEIWSEHFQPMFDAEILPKLIEGAQSKRAILREIEDGYEYFFIVQNDERIGYFAYKVDQQQSALYLSKIYIFSNQRRKGVGKVVLNHLEQMGRDAQIGKIALTVYHKNVNSIKAYEKWGFMNLGPIQRRFDNGLVFEDVIMEKSL